MMFGNSNKFLVLHKRLDMSSLRITVDEEDDKFIKAELEENKNAELAKQASSPKKQFTP